MTRSKTWQTWRKNSRRNCRIWAKKNPEFKALNARRANPSTSPNSGSASQKQMEDLQKSLGKAGENPAALDKLSEQMQKLQQAAAGLSKDNSAQAAAERQKLAQNLSDLAKQAQELGQPMPNLDDAIAALQANQTENFQKDMDLATTDLEKVQQMSKDLAAASEGRGPRRQRPAGTIEIRAARTGGADRWQK